MALGTIAAIGAAGVAVNNFIFNHTKKDYEVKVNVLEGQVNQLKGHLEKLRQLRANVPNFWNDADGQSTCKALDQTIATIEREMEYAESLIRIFKKAIAEFDSNKVTVGSLLEDAIGILGGLGG